MSNTVIKVENLSKLYRLGEVGTGTISHDLNRLWARLQGKEDPFQKIGHVNDRSEKAEKGEHVWALKDMNFDVNQGEVLGIIGKNGAGKSTLLKLLSRVTAPTTGSIKVKGRVASLLEVGTGFHPEMTGRENIFMNGTILGMTRREIQSKLDAIVAFAGVAKYLDTPTKRYSSGMSVRLAFAVAAFLEPEILIVDEVLAVGDAEFQKRAIGKMQDISIGEGRTVLFVSHNMSTVKALCQSALILNNGLLALQSTVDEVVDFYTRKSESSEANNDKLPIKNGSFTLQSFSIKNRKNDLDLVYSGSSCAIEFNINGTYTTDNPIVIVWFSNSFGERMLVLSSRLIGTKVDKFDHSVSGEIIIDRIPMMSNNYFLNVALYTNVGQVLAVWHNVKPIVIEPNPEKLIVSLPSIPDRGIAYTNYSLKVVSK